VPSTARDFDGYKLILAPGLAGKKPDLYTALSNASAQVIIGPRSATVTDEMSIPAGGTPSINTMTSRIALHESLPPHHKRPVIGGGHVMHWQERLKGSANPILTSETNDTVLSDEGDFWYLAAWPDASLWDRIIAMGCTANGIKTHDLPDGLRLRQAGARTFAINYAAQAVTWQGTKIAGCGVAVWDDETRIL
jgi:beta-galactosidase